MSPTTIPSKPTVRNAWAETALPADITDPGNSYAQAGWLIGIKPPRQYFNWVLNYTFEAVRYLCQSGAVDYDAGETYSIGDIAATPFVLSESHGQRDHRHFDVAGANPYIFGSWIRECTPRPVSVSVFVTDRLIRG